MYIGKAIYIDQVSSMFTAVLLLNSTIILLTKIKIFIILLSHKNYLLCNNCQIFVGEHVYVCVCVCVCVVAIDK